MGKNIPALGFMTKTAPSKIRQKLVTVVTANYVDLLVPDLLEKSFDAYQRKDFTKRHFQVSVIENTYATAGIVLILLAFEAYRNRIYYLEKKSVHRGKLAEDLSSIFKLKDNAFPEDLFRDIFTEMTIVRDVIVHNHLYEVEIVNDGNWDMISHRQRLLKDYGDHKRLNSGLVVEQTRKTKNLKLNVQPAKIGFEDLYTILVVFDMFVGISNKLFANSYVPFHFTHKFNEDWIDCLSRYLSHFYVINPNKAGTNKLRKVYKDLRASFISFIPSNVDYFLEVVCPKCQDFGFHQPFKIYKCASCDFEIKINSGYVKK